MAKKMTGEEFASKIEWEGGLLMATREYGLSAKDLDPESDSELHEALVKYDEWLQSGEELIKEVNYHLSAYEPE